MLWRFMWLPFHFSNDKDLNKFLTENEIQDPFSRHTLFNKKNKKVSLNGYRNDNPDINTALDKINNFGSYEDNYVDQVSVKSIKAMK